MLRSRESGAGDGLYIYIYIYIIFYGRVSEERKIERAKVYALKEPYKENQEGPLSFFFKKRESRGAMQRESRGDPYPKT